MQKINKSDGALLLSMCKTIIEDASDIVEQLDEDSCMPTWWVSKLAITSAYINSLRDFAKYNTSESEESEQESEDSEEETHEVSEELEEDDMLPPSYRVVSYAP